jgi:hypothetical protein
VYGILTLPITQFFDPASFSNSTKNSNVVLIDGLIELKFNQRQLKPVTSTA